MGGFKLSLFLAFISCLAYTQAGVFDSLSSEEFLQLCTEKQVNSTQLIEEGNEKLASLARVQENCNGPQHETIITDVVKEASKCLHSEPAPDEIKNTVQSIIQHGCASQENYQFEEYLKEQCPQERAAYDKCMIQSGENGDFSKPFLEAIRKIISEGNPKRIPSTIPKQIDPSVLRDHFLGVLIGIRHTKDDCDLIRAGMRCKNDSIKSSCGNELLNLYEKIEHDHAFSHC